MIAFIKNVKIKNYKCFENLNNKKDGEILVGDGKMKTALDYMRKIEWE